MKNYILADFSYRLLPYSGPAYVLAGDAAPSSPHLLDRVCL